MYLISSKAHRNFGFPTDAAEPELTKFKHVGKLPSECARIQCRFRNEQSILKFSTRRIFKYDGTHDIVSSWREIVSERTQAWALTLKIVYGIGFITLPPALASSLTHFLSKRISARIFFAKKWTSWRHKKQIVRWTTPLSQQHYRSRQCSFVGDDFRLGRARRDLPDRRRIKAGWC